MDHMQNEWLINGRDSGTDEDWRYVPNVNLCEGSLEMEARMMRFFHVTAWGIPLLLAAIALGDRAVGNSNDFVSSGWCWIKYRQDWWKMKLWMFLAGKGWEILAYVTICVFYVLVKLQIRREVRMIYRMK